jgi:hypothetical protein
MQRCCCLQWLHAACLQLLLTFVVQHGRPELLLAANALNYDWLLPVLHKFHGDGGLTTGLNATM